MKMIADGTGLKFVTYHHDKYLVPTTKPIEPRVQYEGTHSRHKLSVSETSSHKPPIHVLVVNPLFHKASILKYLYSIVYTTF